MSDTSAVLQSAVLTWVLVATCELQALQEHFQKLSEMTSFRRKYFDKKSFQKTFFVVGRGVSEGSVVLTEGPSDLSLHHRALLQCF